MYSYIQVVTRFGVTTLYLATPLTGAQIEDICSGISLAQYSSLDLIGNEIQKRFPQSRRITSIADKLASIKKVYF